jgi:phage major head subunit gpT-like protein
MAAGMMIPSTAAYEKLGWLGAMPTVQQWLGEIQAKQLEDYDYTIKNKDWAVAVPVNENDVADDQTGVHTMFPAMLAQRLMRHPEKLMIDLLLNGDSDTAYDGVAFFSDVSGARTIDNLLAGTGTDLGEVEADLNAALVAMAKFTDDQGEALNLRGDLIVCPVAMENTFRRLVQSTSDPTVSGGIETFNPYNGRFTVIGDPRLDADEVDHWYLLSTQEIVKPFVFSMRQAAENRFEKKNGTKSWIWSADYRGNAGYGIPHLAVKTVN